MIEAGTIACDATFMIRHPILFTAMTIAFIPCGTVLAIILWRLLNTVLPIVLKETEESE